MAKTQLNLELHYKGKDLDKIKHGSGLFKKEWFIGSNKHLLWQVLLPSFPDKHKLITQKGNELYLNLLPGSQLECVKNGQNMDQSALSGQGLLRGNSLLLRNDMEGTLTLHPDWQVKYGFGKPYTLVLSNEQQQIVATYSRRAESTPQEKFGRSMILLFLALTIVILGIYDIVLKPGRAETTLQATLARMRAAQRVELHKQEVPVAERDDEAARLAAEAAAKAAAEAAAAQKPTPGTTTARPGRTTAGVGTLFGVGKFDPRATERAPIAITQTVEFAAATRGGTGGGGGTGTGPGAGGTGFGGGGTGGGMASTFDPNAISRYQQSDFSSASSVGGLTGGTSTRPAGRVDVRGNISQAEIAVLNKPVAVTSGERAAISRISQRAPAITEGNIAAAPQEYQSDMEALRRAVNSRKSQLTSLYRKTAAIQSSGGSVDIRIYGTGSRIEAVEVIPISGNLPTSFLNEIKQAVSNWSVSGVTGSFNYKFNIRFG